MGSSKHLANKILEAGAKKSRQICIYMDGNEHSIDLKRAPNKQQDQNQVREHKKTRYQHCVTN